MRKINRRNFLKVSAVASAAGLLSAAPVAASAAAPAAPPVPLPALTVQRLTTS